MMTDSNILVPTTSVPTTPEKTQGTVETNGQEIVNNNKLALPPSVADALSSVDVAQMAAKVESIKKWTIGTFKNSRQQLLENLGKIDKTVDEEFEKRCEEIKEVHKKYGAIVAAAKNFSKVIGQMSEAEKKFSEAFAQLALKETAIKSQCETTASAMKQVGSQAESLDALLRYFVSSMGTIHSQSIADTLDTIYSTEGARIEFDVIRHELTALQSSQADASTAIAAATQQLEDKQAKYEQLKKDVLVKLRLLEENRVQVVASQLEKLHTALAAYYSGNAKLLEDSVRELSLTMPPVPSYIPEM